jgi:OFA family oxalate/formate antiporter-like MFS transporter
MSNEKMFNRWIIVVAAIIIQVCLGAVYAFSVLIPPLETEFGWTRIETSPAFTIALLVFALSMIPAGRLQDKKGPKTVATRARMPKPAWGTVPYRLKSKYQS